MAERPVFTVVTEPEVSLIVNAFFTSAERAQTLDKPLRQATEKYSEEIAHNFEAEGRPSGWPQLSELTIKTRKSEGYGSGPILTRSSTLKEEATSSEAWEVGGGGQLVVADLSVVDYGRFHLTGAPNSHMPMRDWAYLSPEAEAEMDDLFLDWITQPLEALP